MTFWSFLSALVASATALWIAYYVYPFQKGKDRHLKIQEEKASVYKNFIEITENYFNALQSGFFTKSTEAGDKLYPEALKAIRVLSLYAPKEVMLAANEYTEALFTYRYGMRRDAGMRVPPNKIKGSTGAAFHHAKAARDSLLVEARKDLMNCSEDEAFDVIFASENEIDDGVVK